ncbi:MAG TPA: hypothetical protein VLA39_07440 [Marinobacterium sp.]|nr:hypothetical protein [Marinobacterium sp.]
MTFEDPNSNTELWTCINAGDEIELEADLIVGGVTKLHGGRFYRVLAKTDSQGESHFTAFVVQSEITDELLQVAPAFVCNYRVNSSMNLA